MLMADGMAPARPGKAAGPAGPSASARRMPPWSASPPFRRSCRALAKSWLISSFQIFVRTSAGHVQDGIRVSGGPPQGLDGLSRREDEQLDVSADGFELHLNHGQGAGAGPDDQATGISRGSFPPLRPACGRTGRGTSRTASSSSCEPRRGRSRHHGHR